MEGGIESGFKKIEESTDSILYHIKGRRNPVLQQVPLSGESLNDGDVFILQSPKKIFLWIGNKANLMEKQKGNQVCSMLRSKYPKLQFERLDYGETSPEFWELLGGETPIKSAEEAGSDAEFEASKIRSIAKLVNGAFEQIAVGPPAKRDLLTSDGVFIIIRGTQCVIYSGRNCNKADSNNAMITADAYLKSHDLPPWVPIATVKEGGICDQLDLIFT